jgi:hypothetical protein
LEYLRRLAAYVQALGCRQPEDGTLGQYWCQLTIENHRNQQITAESTTR